MNQSFLVGTTGSGAVHEEVNDDSFGDRLGNDNDHSGGDNDINLLDNLEIEENSA